MSFRKRNEEPKTQVPKPNLGHFRGFSVGGNGNMGGVLRGVLQEKELRIRATGPNCRLSETGLIRKMIPVVFNVTKIGPRSVALSGFIKAGLVFRMSLVNISIVEEDNARIE